MKTLNSLGTKPWYRILKILYILVLVATALIIYSMYVPSNDSVHENIILPFVVVFIILNILKRIFYYIYFGTINPIKVEVATYIARIKETLKSFKEMSNLPDTTNRFLADVSRVAKIEIERFERDNSSQDLARLTQVSDLVTIASYLHQHEKSAHMPTTQIQVSALHLAHKLGMDISLIKIDL